MNKPRTIRLQTLVSLVISLSMVLLSAILISQSYFSQSSRALITAQQRAQLIAQTITGTFEQHNQMLMNALRLLSLDPIQSNLPMDKRLERVKSLVQALDNNPLASSFYIGYPNGDFIMLRRLCAEHKVGCLRLQVIERKDNAIEQSYWQDYDPQTLWQAKRPMPDYRFDPRTRNWFTQAQKSQQFVITEPYTFYTTKELGVTFALKTPSGAIIAADESLSLLSQSLRKLRPNDQTQLALIDQHNRFLGLSNQNNRYKIVSQSPQDKFLTQLAAATTPENQFVTQNIANQSWYGLKLKMTPHLFSHWSLLFIQPKQVILAGTMEQMQTQLWISIALALLLIWLGWLLGQWVVKPLQQLALRIDALRTFDFSTPLPAHSPIAEFSELATLINKMTNAIRHFQLIAQTLATEKNYQNLLHHVTQDLSQMLNTQATIVYRYNKAQSALELAEQTTSSAPEKIVLNSQQTEQITEQLMALFAKQDSQLITTALMGRQGQLLGYFILQFPPLKAQHYQALKHFIEQTSAAAALAIETQIHVESQSKLIDAIIQLLAQAIDTKSPYTGGHCRRVPMLSQMILTKLEQSDQGVFAPFKLTETQQREFQIAAWLHDCGKITIPEHVVDKATKLETIYNRIHEVRTRFEVLYQDAQLRYWQQLYYQTESQATLTQQLITRQNELQEQFALIATLNLGQEQLDPHKLSKLDAIAQQTWLRHFDNQLGLSEIERARMDEQPQSLPVVEQLLMDRPQDLIEWGTQIPPVEKDNPENHWGFDMQLPRYRYNLGELHNLAIQRGTLSEEERFLINNHIVQTIVMLSSLPLPQELERVPDLAGNHHEKVNGQGYPRKLSAERLTISDRVIAIADVFEALTAQDRPYHAMKYLSESLNIMAQMVSDEHLDSDIFEQFVREQIYLDYAREFLSPEQIDTIDEIAILQKAGCI